MRSDGVADAEQALARADAVLPGATLGAFRLPDELAFVADRGSGARLWSSDGREFVDWVMSCGPLLLGHAHPRVVAAVAEQARRGTSFYQLNERAVELAETLVRLVPCAEAVRLCGSGTEATFYALRIARAATGRSAVIKFSGSYLGAHDYGLHVLGPDGRSRPESAGIPPGVREDVLVAPFNSLDAVEQLVDQHRERIAAIAVEPVQRAIEPLPGFLEGLRRICDASGALLVFDEVVTGFRLALGGGQEAFGVVPDLCALGKGLGGGLALGAVAGARELIELTEPGVVGTSASAGGTGNSAEAVYMSGSLNGNPLSCAAAIATLEVLEDGGIAQIAETGRRLSSGLEEAAAEVGVPLHAIGPSAFPEPVIGDGRVTDLASYDAQNRRASVAFGLELIRRGIFVFPGFKLYPSTAHEPADLDRTVERARDALVAVRDQGLLEAGS